MKGYLVSLRRRLRPSNDFFLLGDLTFSEILCVTLRMLDFIQLWEWPATDGLPEDRLLSLVVDVTSINNEVSLWSTMRRTTTRCHLEDRHHQDSLRLQHKVFRCHHIHRHWPCSNLLLLPTPSILPRRIDRRTTVTMQHIWIFNGQSFPNGTVCWIAGPVRL